jgi:hypothetical protein
MALTAAERILFEKMSKSYVQQANLGAELAEIYAEAAANATDIDAIQEAIGDKTVIKGMYDFSVQGGAQGAIELLSDLTDGTSTITIPDNAIITRVLIDVITDPTSGGSATIAVDSEGAGDLLVATAIGSWTGLVDGIPVNTAATSVKMTADRTLQVTVATADLMAGVFNVFVEYLVSD